MKIALTVTYLDGGKKDVVAQFSDFVGFERTWQRSVARFETVIRLTDLAWLAWSADTRMKATALKFDPDWITTIESVEITDDKSGAEIPLETTQPLGL